MAVTYGFFNSLDSDRLYNADQMSTYFKGLVSDGVYESVDDAMIVRADTGMNVTVGTGRAIIDCKWINIDALADVTISASHVTLNRYSAVCVHLDVTNRLMEVISINGTNATNPTRPVPQNTSTDKYLVLAYVYVGAGATSITQANIIDTRMNTAICGWVTGLIKQVDTSQLFLQWQTAYEEAYSQWQNTFANFYETTALEFDAWFEELTDRLNVSTYIEEYKKKVTNYGADSSYGIPLNMPGYSYDPSDIVDVYINGLYADEGTDYTIQVDGPGDASVIFPILTGNTSTISISVKKSRIGFSVLSTAEGSILVTDSNLEIQV